MFDAIIKTNDHFEFLTGEERLYFLMNSSDEAIINYVAKCIYTGLTCPPVHQD